MARTISTVLVLVLMLTLGVVTAATAHNRAHIILHSGKCITVGTDK